MSLRKMSESVLVQFTTYMNYGSSNKREKSYQQKSMGKKKRCSFTVE